MNWKNYLNVSSDKPVIPFIVGPTASGKTALAIDLARQIGGEIISADSRQIYKHMDIATAKPTDIERAMVPHHLVDFVEPDTFYTVADYYQDGTKKIDEILERGNVPIVCGGTGLYVNALTKPFVLDIDSTDSDIRDSLEREAEKEGGKERLYERLLRIDPESAKKIHPNNLKRVIRALEIYYVSKKTKSQLEREKRESAKELDFTPVLLMPQIDRDILYERINKRVDQMIEDGLIEEVIELDKNYSRSLNSMQTIGYREFFPYLDGLYSLEEAKRILKRDTRHYAKRQLTWFRNDPRVLFIK